MPMGKMPVAGEAAPEFQLPDSTRVPRRLSELVSQAPLVLVFYRGDW
jgi:peroxiredoxin